MREEERLWSRNFCMDFDVIAYSRRTYMTQKTESYYLLVSLWKKINFLPPSLAWPCLLATTTFIYKLSYTSLYIYIL